MEHFDWLLGFWFPYINFAIFLALAIYFFRRPLAKIASGRRDSYIAAVKAANEARDQAIAKLAEIDRRMAGLDEEVLQIKNGVAQEAEREAARVIEAAEKLAAHLREEAERIADAELKKAQQKLRRTILAEVKGEVEAKIRREFGPAQQSAYTAARTLNLQNLTTRI